MLARCGPLSLLGASFVLMVGGLGAPGPAGLALASGVLLVAVPLTVGPGRFPWARLVPGLLAIASVAWSNWLLASPRSWEAAGFAGLRIGFFVLPGVVFASFVDPAVLGDHLGQRLRLPARPVLAAVAALQRFERFGADWEDLGRARRVRGLGPSRSPVSALRAGAAQAMGLLVGALRDATDSAVAMEARGFSRPARTGTPRTWAVAAPWTRADTALLVGCLAATTIALAGTPVLAALAGR
nr:energy-coupling factor transporter transmembrane component T [Propionicicella superfundia]